MAASCAYITQPPTIGNTLFDFVIVNLPVEDLVYWRKKGPLMEADALRGRGNDLLVGAFPDMIAMQVLEECDHWHQFEWNEL